MTGYSCSICGKPTAEPLKIKVVSVKILDRRTYETRTVPVEVYCPMCAMVAVATRASRYEKVRT